MNNHDITPATEKPTIADLKKPEPPHVPTTDVVEPFTLAWVAEMFVGGIISAIGAMIFTSLVDKYILRNKTLPEQFATAIDDICAFIDERIEQHTVDMLVGTINGITNLFGEYTRNVHGERNRQLLQDGLAQLEVIISQCEKIGIKASGASVFASALRVCMLQENIRTDKNDFINLIYAVHRYRALNLRMTADLWQWHLDQYTLIGALPPRPPQRPSAPRTFFYEEYGEMVVVGKDYNEAVEHRKRRMEAGPKAIEFKEKVLHPHHTADYWYWELERYIRPYDTGGELGDQRSLNMLAATIQQNNATVSFLPDSASRWILNPIDESPAWAKGALLTSIQLDGTDYYLTASMQRIPPRVVPTIPARLGRLFSVTLTKGITPFNSWVVEPNWNGGWKLRAANFQPDRYLSFKDSILFTGPPEANCVVNLELR